MAAIGTPAESPVVAPRGKNWHRYRLAVCGVMATALLAAIAVYGVGYYRLDAVHRVASPLHGRLRPSGSLGHPMGIVGAALFGLLFLYPLRKRWRWLSKKGKTKHWLDFHILIGLSAPVLVTFHSALKLHGVAGLSYWIMMAVVASGIVGRYLYAQIPRRLDAAEMSLQEMQADCVALAAQIRSQNLLQETDIAPLLDLPPVERVMALPLGKAIIEMLAIDLRRWTGVWKLRRRAGGALASREMRDAIALVRRQAVLSKRVLFLARTQQIFHLWHVVHRPFSYSFAILVCLHVAIVMLMGFY